MLNKSLFDRKQERKNKVLFRRKTSENWNLENEIKHAVKISCRYKNIKHVSKENLR